MAEERKSAHSIDSAAYIASYKIMLSDAAEGIAQRDEIIAGLEVTIKDLTDERDRLRGKLLKLEALAPPAAAVSA